MAKLVAIVFMALMVSALAKTLIDTDYDDGYGDMYAAAAVKSDYTANNSTTEAPNSAGGLKTMSAIFLTFIALITKNLY